MVHKLVNMVQNDLILVTQSTTDLVWLSQPKNYRLRYYLQTTFLKHLIISTIISTSSMKYLWYSCVIQKALSGQQCSRAILSLGNQHTNFRCYKIQTNRSKQYCVDRVVWLSSRLCFSWKILEPSLWMKHVNIDVTFTITACILTLCYKY